MIDGIDFEGITVNGLVIAKPRSIPVLYYRRFVMKGPGAFIEVAADYEDYARAIKRKLLREILGDAFALRR